MGGRGYYQHLVILSFIDDEAVTFEHLPFPVYILIPARDQAVTYHDEGHPIRSARVFQSSNRMPASDAKVFPTSTDGLLLSTDHKGAGKGLCSVDTGIQPGGLLIELSRARSDKDQL